MSVTTTDFDHAQRLHEHGEEGAANASCRAYWPKSVGPAVPSGRFCIDHAPEAAPNLVVAKPLRGSRIHILGVAYKKDIEDVRESPALDVIQLLQRRGAVITFSDPYVEHIHVDGGKLHSQEPLSGVEAADCVAVITNHSSFDYAAIIDGNFLLPNTSRTTFNFDCC